MSEERRRQAAALSSASSADSGGAPTVVARGYGELAEQIVAEARRHGLYVHEAPELVGLLMQLELDQQIPESLYQVIGELLQWLHEVGTEAEDRD